MDLNVNDEVLVKLTPYALAILVENHFKLFNGAKHAPRFEPPKVDADGWSRMHLWRLMQEFGGAMYNGNPNQCFEGNTVRLLGAARRFA